MKYIITAFRQTSIFTIVKMKHTNAMATKQLHCQNRKFKFFRIPILW